MTVLSTTPTSRRGYLSQAELQQFADITITNTSEADDRISQAEEIIDAYVGFQTKAIRDEIVGRCSSNGGSNFFYLSTNQLNVYQNNYLKLCEVEILGGTGEGQRRKIITSDYTSGKITVDSDWVTTPDTTSFYKIYQLGKFPRNTDLKFYTESIPYEYYKSIPEAVKRAVAAQVEFMISMGDNYFSSDKTLKQSERLSTYSYTLAEGQKGINRLIAPKAKMLLTQVRNRVGVMA